MNPDPHQMIRKPAGSAAKSVPVLTANPDLAAYSQTVTIECEQCGGSGRDRGALDNFLNGTEPVCPTCHGLTTQAIVRNYLSEAFAIASNKDSTCPVDRMHVVAIIRYAREHVSALFQHPEVA